VLDRVPVGSFCCCSSLGLWYCYVHWRGANGSRLRALATACPHAVVTSWSTLLFTVLYTPDVPSSLIFYHCLTNDRRKTPSLLPTVPVATAP
jgi:hypothetical protein